MRLRMHQLDKEDGEWQRMRLLYSILYNVNVKKGHQKSAQELIGLPSDGLWSDWDKIGMTEEEFIALKEKWAPHLDKYSHRKVKPES